MILVAMIMVSFYSDRTVTKTVFVITLMQIYNEKAQVEQKENKIGRKRAPGNFMLESNLVLRESPNVKCKGSDALEASLHPTRLPACKQKIHKESSV